MNEFVEAKKEDLFKGKKYYKDNLSLLRKFFNFLKENGVETLEESFFDEDKSELATKFLEEVGSLEKRSYFRSIKRLAREFVKYCVEEHVLISYDNVRKENANKMLGIFSKEKEFHQVNCSRSRFFFFTLSTRKLI